MVTENDLVSRKNGPPELNVLSFMPSAQCEEAVNSTLILNSKRSTSSACLEGLEDETNIRPMRIFFQLSYSLKPSNYSLVKLAFRASKSHSFILT